MSGEIAVTVVGSITEPTLRFSQQGKAVASFSVASTPRVKDGDNWVDGETTWFRVSVFDQMAENVAESLAKGDRVMVQGRFKTRSYTLDDGTQRSGLELVADEVAPTLRWATAKPVKVGNMGGGQARPAQDTGMQRSRTAQPQGDPWATPAASQEPPF